MRKVAEILGAQLVFGGSGLLVEGEEAAELYVDEVLDGSGRFSYLDSTVSMRGLTETEATRVWDDRLLEDQLRRIHNGS